MLKKYLYFSIILLASLYNFGCKETTKEVKYQLDDIPCTSLAAEDLNFKAGNNPMLYKVINDSLVLVSNWTGTPFYLELYNLRDNSLVTQFFKRGNGPNESLSCYVSFKSNTSQLHTFDIIKRQGAIYSIDSILKYGNRYHPPKFNVPTFIGNDIATLDTSTILIFNKYHVTDKQYSNNVFPIFSYNIEADKTDFEFMSENIKFFTHNVTDGFIAVHPIDDIIWLIYQDENRIEVYNKNLELIKALIGPKEFKPEYEIREGYGTEVSYKVSTRTYWHCFYNTNHIYILYFGECSGLEKQPVNLLKFAWDGTPIQRFELDRNLYTVYVDPEEKYVYGTEYIQGDLPKLIKYKIEP